MKASILTIGDEILIGQIVDINSAWIGAESNKIGLSINQILSISDTNEAIIASIEYLHLTSDIIFVTGGLGPTNDDVTKHCLSEYYGSEMHIHEEALKNVEDFLRKRNAELNENNRNQALFPDKADFIPNLQGTASGMWFEKEGKVVISMPGVPHEMKAMMSNWVFPKIQQRYKLPFIHHKVVHTTGIPEAKLAEILTEWEAGLDKRIALAYLPSPGLNKLRLSITGENKEEIKHAVDDEINKLYNIIPDNIIGFDEETVSSAVGRMLKAKKQTLAVAESCTSGSLAAEIASIPGCSDYFKGSAVTYANEAKIGILGVSADAIEDHGAVSQQVVEQMALGAMKKYNTDYAIATSGVAGPGGGTDEKPVGTVWIALAGGGKLVSQKFTFGSDRLRNIQRSVMAGLEMLRQELSGDE